jgi:L-alanine-DL-glutamate epimerase-like enolase superfamily enzyme
MALSEAPIGRLAARIYRIPTDGSESDGTFEWEATTMLLVQIDAGGRTGLGYSYTSAAAANVVEDSLSPVITGQDAFDIPRLWSLMVGAVRNLGSRGVCASAISAIDCALWDLKAKLLEIPLVSLLGSVCREVPIYGSGGFTSYSDDRLRRQLAGWVERDGCRAVKMKVGREPGRDRSRIHAARASIGDADLYIDANGAFTPKHALAFAETISEERVSWFEEPVSSDDLTGLRLMRDRAPALMDIAAGEYGYDSFYFRRMLAAEAVDVLQADATRCGGVTGFLKAATLADAYGRPISAHTAPALHLHAAAAAPRLMNIEWFHDHVLIERIFFDGAPIPANGTIKPDLSRPGFGLVFKESDADRFTL